MYMHTDSHTLAVADVQVVMLPDLLYYTYKTLTATYLPRIHGDWVCQVKYCANMEYCMSCSNDSACSLHLVDRNGRKEASIIRVRKGISSFDYCKDWNILGKV